MLKRFDLGKNGFANFFVFSIVSDYADTVSAYSTTTRTCVSVVNNYGYNFDTVNYFTLEEEKPNDKVTKM